MHPPGLRLNQWIHFQERQTIDQPDKQNLYFEGKVIVLFSNERREEFILSIIQSIDAARIRVPGLPNPLHRMIP